YRLNLRENRPAVELASSRVADYFHQRGLSGAGLQQETSRVLGGFATIESVAHGFRSGLRFLSLMMLAIGLPVAIFLAHAARGLRGRPGRTTTDPCRKARAERASGVSGNSAWNDSGLAEANGMRVVRSPAAIVALIAATLAWAQSPSTVEPSRVLGLLCQGPTVWSGSPAATA
ncbi:MAG: hypothetical protein ACXWN0_14860, partial [Isosphaeraceae bacterium]